MPYQKNNAYASYNNNKVLTATPAELTLMLYEGAIKFGNIAEKAMEERNIEKAHNNIVKVRDIVAELLSTLNFQYPVANDFANVYNYLLDRLIDVNIKKDPEIMEEILGHLRVMRDTWKEVMNINRMAKAN